MKINGRLRNLNTRENYFLKGGILFLHYLPILIMIETIRDWYNQSFTAEKFNTYHKRIEQEIGDEPHFRLSETPIFVPKTFKERLLDACNELIDVVEAPGFYQSSEKAIPDHLRFANDPGYSPILIFDFGICDNEKGELIPQLIEMQGFPSLFSFMTFKSRIVKDVFGLPDHLSSYIHTDEANHIHDLRKLFLGDHQSKEVILLDYKPEEQKTKIDFAATKKLFDIEAVCVTQLKQDGKKLYYEKEGKRQNISRIYNRLIFDEFFDLKLDTVDLRQDLELEWAPHPNWFCRVSKYILPSIRSRYVPQTSFISDLKSIPDDLENYVLKPVYSYAGMGVKIDVTKADIESVSEPDQWILQKKVHYIPAIKTPNQAAKAEIRMMIIKEAPNKRPRVVHNLARMSKGKMIGVRYNADFDWVGSSICYFE
jgi:hypothetical protein